MSTLPIPTPPPLKDKFLDPRPETKFVHLDLSLGIGIITGVPMVLRLELQSFAVLRPKIDQPTEIHPL
jgi:hypothetical protein